jgi:hypothetical protein
MSKQGVQELRIYSVKTGCTRAFVDHFEQVGLPIAKKYMFLVGFWTTKFGNLNDVYHLWDFESLAHRDEIRAFMHQDSDWRSLFIPKVRELVVRQQSIILEPANFCPIMKSNRPSK